MLRRRRPSEKSLCQNSRRRERPDRPPVRAVFRRAYESLEQRLPLTSSEISGLPRILFERNDGQAAETARFLTRGADFDLTLFQDGALLSYGQAGAVGQPSVQMSWARSGAATRVVGVRPVADTNADASSGNPVGSHPAIARFERVRYDDVHAGIDLEFYARADDVEFDWIVDPGVDPAQITMTYAGMDHLSLDAAGNLVISTASAQIIQHAPVVYQLVDGQQQGVASSYRLADNGEVRFALGDYDSKLTLVIDPVLSYSTYLGGNRNDFASDIAVDQNSGNAYVLGTTQSANLITNSDTPDSLNHRAILSRFRSNGLVDEIYSTILGPLPKYDESGYAESVGHQVLVAGNDQVIVGYETWETATVDIDGPFPLPGPAHLLHVQKLNDEGQSVFDTILPVLDKAGYFNPIGFSNVQMATDDLGDIYVVYAAVRPTAGGGVVWETFFTKLFAHGQVWFTQRLDHSVAAIAVDAEHNIYLAWNDLVDVLDEDPTREELRANVLVEQWNPGLLDILGFVSMGGDRDDFVTAIAVDPSKSGLVYAVGNTSSVDFPLKNAFQQRPPSTFTNTSDDQDAFLTLLDLTKEGNDRLVASTYFGGRSFDALTDVALDRSGNVYVAGMTTSPNLPVVSALQAAWTEASYYHGAVRKARDLFVSKFNSTLASLEFSTYFGGIGDDSYASLAIARDETIHVAATTVGWNRNITTDAFESTADFPVLPAARSYQSEFGGPSEGGGQGTDEVVFAIVQRGAIVGNGLHVTAGREFTHHVAEFSSRRLLSPSDFTVIINWGDGESTDGFVTHPKPESSQYFVHGTHQYEKPGAYPVKVTVVDRVVERLSPLRNINVSQAEESQISGAIAVDPTKPTRLFAAMADYQLDQGFRVATSDDSGATWSPRLVAVTVNSELPPARGIPDVLFDDFGNLFVAYQSIDDDIVVAWSADGGRTFESADIARIEASGAAGSLPGTPRLAFGASRNEVWVTYETDNVLVAGASVGGLGDVGGFIEFTVTGAAGGKYSDIAVSPDGAVAVVWQTIPAEGGTAELRSSVDVDGLDAGVFTLPVAVHTSTTDGILHSAAQPVAMPLGAQLAWDTSQGPHRGRLYATYVDMVQGLPDPPGIPELTLFVTSSDDSGVSWSTPQRVTLGPDFQSMFQPSIAVDPTTGILAVAWYSTTGSDPAELSAYTGYFVATSLDGRTFSNAQFVNIDPSNVVDPELAGPDPAGYGAAPVIAFYDGRLYPIWSDNTSLEGGNYSAPQFETATRIVGVIEVSVAPAAIKMLPIQTTAGQAFSGPVASFTHADSSLGPQDFDASMTIYWGDGTGSPGDITQPSGPGTEFIVSGSHTYAQAGAYPLWVHVRDRVHGVDSTPVSNISVQQGNEGEGTIATDPNDPDRAFAAWVHEPRSIPIAISEDGGVTWTNHTIADGTDGLPQACCDPRAVFDDFGNLFLTYLTLNKDSIAVLISTNGGHDFDLLKLFSSDLPASDLPSIAVGPGPDGTEGSVWLAWKVGPVGAQVIMAAGAPVHGLGRDNVGGFESWEAAPADIDGRYQHRTAIAVGPQGQVLMTYVTGSTDVGPVEVITRLDADGLGPDSFGLLVEATKSNVGFKVPILAAMIRPIDVRVNLAWDRSNGPHGGRAYLVYTDSPAPGSADTNIFIRYSDTDGLHWSEPIQVHDDDALSQFFPALAVDQSTGNVGVGWHTAVEPSNVRTRYAATLSDDGGSTFRSAYLVSPGESDATDYGPFQYGDYTTLAFANGLMQPIWADNSLELEANPDPQHFELASARIAVAQVNRAPLVVQMFDVNEHEGTEFTRRIASFTDPSGPVPDPSGGDGGQVVGYHATIDWGDNSPPTEGEILLEIDGGFSVSGTHTYKKLGHYPISVLITGDRVKGTGTVTAEITDAPLDITIAQNLRMVREHETTKVVGTLTDFNRHSTAEDFIVTVEWGDGMASPATLLLQPSDDGSGGDGGLISFSISATHKYLSEETFSINVSVRDKTAEKTHNHQGNLISGDPPLIVNPGEFLDIEALEGINTGDLVLVKFERADDIEVPLDTTVGEYTATINWGDGEVDTDIVPFVTSEDVTVVGRHTYVFAGEFYPTISLVDDSGGFFTAPLIAIVEPDVTSQVRAISSGLEYDPLSDRFVGELNIANTSGVDISGPLFVVIHDLPEGVSLESFTAEDGAGNPIYKVNQSKLPADASLPTIPLEFKNPARVPINYRVQVFDGLRPQPVGGNELVFEPNRGQASEAVSFVARGQGYTIGLSDGEVGLVLEGIGTQAGAAALLELVGANDSPTHVAVDVQPGVSNYFFGSNAITAVPHYGRVSYTDVYTGIDLEYYGRDGLLEYDWIVHPHAATDAIAMRFRGVDGMVLDRAGNLRLTVDGGELVQRAPIAYQHVGGTRIDVTADFDLRDNGTVGFTLGTYDHSMALVIDPVLVYSTYLGGSGFESAESVAVDAAGNTYVTGYTGSSDFFTVNPFDPELNQPDTSPFWLSVDAFVTKFDADGVPVYSSYLGGGSSVPGVIRDTIAHSIAVDALGHAWLGGSTQSPTFPTTRNAPAGWGPDPTLNGAGFITELSADGSSLLYSSLVTLAPYDLAVDADRDVYATGIFGHALKLDPASNTVRYVKYLGDGIAHGIAVDSIGQAYVAGFTQSSTFPTKNALFPELQNRQLDERNNPPEAFVVKLASDGDIMFSTYLGGRFSDTASDIAVDSFGVIYVVGQTQSDDLPVTGGLDTSLGGSLGSLDGFLIKLANDGRRLLYGTYIGGSGNDQVTGVGVDAQGRTYLSGITDSTDLPTVRAHQPTWGGSQFVNYNLGDGFAASIATDGASFDYLTYWGGSQTDKLVGVAVDSVGNASYVGDTNSLDLQTRNAAQSSPLGFPTFIVRLLAGDAGTISLHNAPFTITEGNTYDGVVAFFTTNGTETAEQFTATIDWGDGLTSAGAIAGNFTDGFQIFGNHLYAGDSGTHDFFVTVRDSQGRNVTVTSTGTGVGNDQGRAHYRVAIDTLALAGTAGQLSFQFNPGALPGGLDAEARITALTLVDGLTGGTTINGTVVQHSSSQFTVTPSAVLNRLVQAVTLGSRIEFDLEFVGPGLTQPAYGDFASLFALQLVSADGLVALLSDDTTANLLRLDVLPDGTTRVRSSAAALTVAASGRATVDNAAVSLTLVPVAVQEGLEFSGPVATFTNGTLLERAEEFTAQIDWGDGSPVSAGVISGSGGNFTVSGAHVYQEAGSYTLLVKLLEPDGLEVTSVTGRSILAGLTFKNNLSPSQVPPVSGDFNGDGILDVAVGPFRAVPASPLETGVGILLGRGDGSFELGGFQVTGPNVIKLVTADFNNDGNLDAATVVSSFGTPAAFELLLGNGDGTLQPSLKLAELTSPSTSNNANLVAVDFNRDGNMDLVYTATIGNSLTVALGRGDGRFESPASIALSGGLAYVADMDADAVPDIILATSNFGTSALQFHRGLGNGSFAATIPFAAGLVLGSVAIEDFDGDGYRDIVASVLGNLNVYIGNGDGTFEAPRQTASGAIGNLVPADFDGDGQVDLAMSDLGGGSDLGRVTVFLNDRAGSFEDPIHFEGVNRPLGILAGDFDRDGHIDVATAGNTSVISVLPGNGDGSFASAVRYATGFADPFFQPGPVGVSTADVNGDTHTDAILIMKDGPIVTQLGNGDGTFQSIVSGNAGNSARGPVLADINDDGRLDVLAPSQTSGISVVLGGGDGTFPTNDERNPGHVSGTVLADFNQDGRLDVASNFDIPFTPTGRVAIRLANADGSLQERVNYPMGFGLLTVGDFNADSHPDLARATLGGISVLLGNADGTFATAINTVVGTFPFDPHSSPESARVGDFDEDGKLDIVQVSFWGNGLVLPGNGDGTFATGLPFTNNTTSRDVAVGDINGDDHLDLVSVEESGEHFSVREQMGGVSVLLGNGNGTFQAPVNYSAGVRPLNVTVADFNQDGRPDIAAANRDSNNVSIFLGSASGGFPNVAHYSTTGARPRSMGTGDLNGDGNLDLVVVNQSNDTAILLGNSDGTFQPARNYSTRGDGLLGGRLPVAIGDLDGDTRVDLIAGDSLLYGNGDGTFRDRRLFIYLPAVINAGFQTSEPQDIAPGHFNDDVNLDIVVSMRGTTAILFGQGNGSFSPPMYLTPSASVNIGANSNRVNTVDMDGDGDLDIVTLHATTAHSGAAVAVWRNDGSGEFSSPAVQDVPFPIYDASPVTGPDMQLSDLDGDGFPDVVVTDTGVNNDDGQSSGGMSVLLGIGDGSLASPLRYLVGSRQTVAQLAIADVNRDSRPEIMAITHSIGTLSSAVAMFINNGQGGFGPAQIYDHGNYQADFLATGDFNEDQAADIIVPDGEANHFSIIFAGNGPLIVTDAPVIVTGTDLNPRAGVPFTAIVATFIDENPFGLADDFNATIDWGDGQTSAGSIRNNPLGGFEVSGSHSFLATGQFTTKVTVREIGEGTHRGSAMARVSDTSQDLSATGLTFQAMEDLLFRDTVATFTDANLNGSIGDFNATIDWGDGQTSTGTVVASIGGGFHVLGSHTYADPGTIPVQVDIVHIGGGSVIANSMAQVAPRINQPPVAMGEAYSTNEDLTLTVAMTPGVLANDTDVDGDVLEAVVVALPTHGTLTLEANGSFTYLPAANFSGTDSFTYQATDGNLLSNVAIVNITVRSVEDGPVVHSDSAVIVEDMPFAIDVLANDTHGDGPINPATLAFSRQPIHGTVTANSVTGVITYTPFANVSGSDTLRYKVRNMNGVLSNEAEVSITIDAVNDAPVAIHNSYVANEDQSLFIAAAQGVLVNDTDVDSNFLTAVVTTAPAHGTLTLAGNGSFSYVPVAEFSGSDSFRYRTSDGDLESAVALVSLMVLPENDAPVISALADAVINEGRPFTGSGSFADSDASDTWTATVDYGDGAGVQALVLVGSTFALHNIYLDDGHYVARVEVTDQSGLAAQATLQVSVQNLPATVHAGADQDADEGDLISVLATFADLGPFDTHLATINWGDGTANQPMQIQEADGAGTALATHAYADEGVYWVTVSVADDEQAVAGDTLAVTVSNVAPQVEAGADRAIHVGETLTLPTLFTTEVNDATLGLFAFQAIAGSFVDPGVQDGHTAIIDWGDGTVETISLEVRTFGLPGLPSGISGVTLGRHSYATHGSYTVNVSVSDNDGGEGSDRFVVAVSPSADNIAPVAANDTATTVRNSAVLIDVLSNDLDVDGAVDPTSVVIVSAAMHGTTSVNPTTGMVTYTPAADYLGPDAFMYTVRDNVGTESNAATLDVTVNSPPRTAVVIGRHLFYNRSSFDGFDAAINDQDDDAIAPHKTPLLPGQRATFANYTSYTRGINGIMIDIQNRTHSASVGAEDFSFRVGNDDRPDHWTSVLASSQIVLRPASGTQNFDRVVITWPDHAIQGQWLQVIVKATDNTGLLADDIFYWGNAVGESGNSSADAFVNALDTGRVRDNAAGILNPATIDNDYDFNRDGFVNALDFGAARDNATGILSVLRLIMSPANAPVPPAVPRVETTTTGPVSPLEVSELYAAIASESDDAGPESHDPCAVDQPAESDELAHAEVETLPGDANRDGIFDSWDLVLVFQTNEYDDERVANSDWCTGDWDGDLDFTSADLVLAFQRGRYRN